MLFFGVVGATWGQNRTVKKNLSLHKSLASGKIVFRNNCITQCANCDSAKGPDQSTIFEYSEYLAPKFRYTWFYGEGNAKSNGRTGRYQYCTSGKKQVKLVFQDTTAVAGQKDSVSTQVIIGQLANYAIKEPKPDTTICLGQNVVLDPFKTIPKQSNVNLVRWFPDGQTTDQITVNKTGCYSAKIFTNDGSGCYVEAKIQVNICGESDPNRNLNKYSEVWNFGNGAQVKFNGSPTSATAEPGNLNVPQGVAKMSDGSKSLIFYSDGVDVYSRFGENINYGPTLNGDKTNSQGVTIVPKPSCKGCQSDYFIFTLSKNANGENQLYYSLVDMSIVKIKSPAISQKDTIRGGVTIRNQLVGAVPTTQRIYATPGGTDYYWLVAQDANSNVIRTYKVTSAGISAASQSTGGTSVSAAASGNTRISVSGTKMAVSIPPNTANGTNKIDLFSYNASTGKDSLLVTVDIGNAPPTIYGVEFSPDEKKLYVSFTGDGTAANKSKIVQYDISFFNKDSILKYQTKIYETIGKIGALQLDPVYQSVIFVSIQDSTYLSGIVNPNSKLTTDPTKISVEYRSKMVDFSSVPTTSPITSQLGLPPSIPSPPTSSSLPAIKMVCEGTKFKFTLDKNLCDPIKNEHIRWKAYKSRLSKLPSISGTMVPLNPSALAFQEPDAQEFVVDFPEGPNEYYTITAEISNKCVTNYLLDGQEFLIQVIKPFSLENVEKIVPTVSTVGCKIEHYLKPTKLPVQKSLTFEWNTGSTIDSILVKNPGGDFTLKISDTTGCSVTQSAKVTFYPQKELLQQADWLICMDDPNPSLKLQVLPLANAISYQWSTLSYVDGGKMVPAGKILSTITNLNNVVVGKDGGYQLVAKDKLGCQVEEKYHIPDLCRPMIIAPTVFNPHKVSSDGSMTKFYPLWNWPVKDFLQNNTVIPNSSPTRTYTHSRTIVHSYKVFNRWGILLFQKDFDATTFNKDASFDIASMGWDGTYQGALVPQDTYAWVVEYESIDFPSLGRQTKSGSVLVVY
ncbi:MAG: hypothetical protein RI995_1270 [Bacteroidota bacterium]